MGMNDKKCLVTYFSAEMHKTENLAEQIAKIAGADLYQIKPQEPYTEEDLYWPNSKCRSVVETLTPGTRPAIITNDLPNIQAYDVVFVGFPLWCHTAPHVVNTFLEACDFSGKTVVPFVTTGGDTKAFDSDASLHASCPANVSWKPAEVLNRVTGDALAKWVERQIS